jgi:site-specific recombinase XerD
MIFANQNLTHGKNYNQTLADLPATIPQSDALSPYLAEAQLYFRSAKAANTVKAYRSDWARFENFCRGRALPSLPAAPATVAAYAADAARRLKANTIERHLTSISQAHQLAQLPNPAEDKLVRTVLAGIRRVKGTAQLGKDPLSPTLLRQMFAGAASSGNAVSGEAAGNASVPNTAGERRAIRDRALLLVGFAGAFRRSELVHLIYKDVRLTPEGLVVTVRQSKTDQEGEGQTVGIPYGSHPESCPVRALERWLKNAGITEGFLFPAIGRWGRAVSTIPLGDHQVARIVKRMARHAGLDPQVFSGHSLRSGLATSAAEGGASERAIMDQTRHRSLKQVRKYIRRGSLFHDNAAARSGL